LGRGVRIDAERLRVPGAELGEFARVYARAKRGAHDIRWLGNKSSGEEIRFIRRFDTQAGRILEIWIRPTGPDGRMIAGRRRIASWFQLGRGRGKRMVRLDLVIDVDPDGGFRLVPRSRARLPAGPNVSRAAREDVWSSWLYLGTMQH
jgi:hypothetical protein